MVASESRPTFSDAEFTVAPLGSLLTAMIGGGTPSTAVADYWNGDIEWTTSAHLNGFSVDRGVRRITQLGLQNSSAAVVPAGNVLIGTRVGVGKVAVTRADIAISQDLTGLLLKHDMIDAEFLAYALSSFRVHGILVAAMRGTTIKGVPRDDVARIPIPVPPLSEQRAIAGVLNTVQEAIGASKRVITAAQQLKRSLMHFLFTYGAVQISDAEQVDRRDTEIGLIPANWTCTELGEVVEGTQYGLSRRGSSLGTYPILRMNNLSDGRVDYQSLQYVDLPENEYVRYALKRGDILFNRNNSHDLVGKTAIFDGDRECVFASYLVRVSVQTARLSPGFLNYYLNWGPTQTRLRAIATRAVSQSNISASKLRKLAVPLPPITDQSAIASILSTVDRKLTVERARLAALEQLFRSLLEQLMTGQLRVN